MRKTPAFSEKRHAFSILTNYICSTTTKSYFARNLNNLCIITLFWYYIPGQIFLLWITWWNTAASFLWICLCTKFMEPTSIISIRKSYITYLNSTECPIWLYWCFRSELLFSKSFASKVQLQLYNSGSIILSVSKT